MSLLLFTITKQFPLREEAIIAKFSNKQDAMSFMESKVMWDHKTKVEAVYRFYEDEDLLGEVNSLYAEDLSGEDEAAGSSQHTSPTPTSTTPRPSSIMPSSYKKDDEDEDEDLK